MPELVLGGVQFGLAYGASNSSSLPISYPEAKRIISYARSKGLNKIDTASAYGTSESVIGKILNENDISDFNIITKIVPFFTLDSLGPEQLKVVEESFKDSLIKLQKKKIYGLMVHHADDLLKPGGYELYQLLSKFKQQGFVKKIGCSFYNRKQIEDVFEKYSMDLVQVPASIFDQRLLKDNFLSKLSRYMEVHIRSVFLQGLIFLDETKIPANIKLPSQEVFKKMNYACDQYGLSKLELALAYFADKNYLKLVIGVTSENELAEIIAAKNRIEEMNLSDIDFDMFSVDDSTLLNPSLWTK